MPQGLAASAGTKLIKPVVSSVPAASNVAGRLPVVSPRTVIEAFWPSETMAQGWMVTVAGAPISMLLGTECFVPAPAHVSLAVMLLEWVSTVPFGPPGHCIGRVTVTIAEPDLLASSLLFALTVYVPGVDELKMAVVA